MLANIDLTDSERRMLSTLNEEERDAVIDQILDTVREELQWLIAVERARKLAASAPQLVAHVEQAPSRSKPAPPRFCWPSSPRR